MRAATRGRRIADGRGGLGCIIRWVSAGPPQNPRPNDIWLDDDGELQVFDGRKWVTYADVPADPVNPNVVVKGDDPTAGR